MPINDHTGRCIQETALGTTHYLWNEFSQYGDVVLETVPVSGNLTHSAHYTLANGMLISQHIPPTGSLYFLSDAQGSTRAMTETDGDVKSSYAYDAFGNLQGDILNSDTKYLYTGQQYDFQTELYSLRARYYDPSIGRFTSRDTWAYNYGNSFELNRYVYAAENPVRWSDPSGHFLLEDVHLREKSDEETALLKEGKVDLAAESNALRGVAPNLQLYARPAWLDGLILTGGLAIFAGVGFASVMFMIWLATLAADTSPCMMNPNSDICRDPFLNANQGVSDFSTGGETSTTGSSGQTEGQQAGAGTGTGSGTETEGKEEKPEDHLVLGFTHWGPQMQPGNEILLPFFFSLIKLYGKRARVHPVENWDRFTITLGEAIKADRIHFNLEEIKVGRLPLGYGYNEFADNYSNGGIFRRYAGGTGVFYHTAWELWHVRSRFCDKTYFYEHGSTSLRPSLEAGKEICGASYEFPSGHPPVES